MKVYRSMTKTGRYMPKVFAEPQSLYSTVWRLDPVTGERKYVNVNIQMKNQEDWTLELTADEIRSLYAGLKD